MSNLKTLNLSSNQITDISSFQELKNLTMLDLCNNKITEIPKTIVEPGLEINFYHDFPINESINLYGNPIIKPPLEIMKRGTRAIRDYLQSLKVEKNIPLNEVKVLLVGDGGAGKTSLVKRLLKKVVEQYLGKKYKGDSAEKRPDLLLTQDMGERYLLIELKKPGHTLDRKDEAQGLEYRDELNLYLPNVKIEIIIMGGQIKNTISSQNQRPDVKYMSYQMMISNARNSL